MGRLEDNLAAVRERIAAAAERSGRGSDAVTLIAVTKYVDDLFAGQLAEAMRPHGPPQFGEARPQELWRKAEALEGRGVEWHLIGHLQRNKIERTLPLVELIHSVDSLRLAAAINDAAGRLAGTAKVLLEVNVSADATKHGFLPDEIERRLSEIAVLPNLHIAGLMAMAGLESSLDDARRQFALLREIRDRISRSAPSHVRLEHLSMGMSGDFEVAIEEGATLVRVGSALFEGLREVTP